MFLYICCVYAILDKHKFYGNAESTTLHTKRGMVLPFEPYSITFDEISYSVDMPQVIFAAKINECLTQDKLVQLSQYIL